MEAGNGSLRVTAARVTDVMDEGILVILSEAKDLKGQEFRPFDRERQERGLRVTIQAAWSE